MIMFTNQKQPTDDLRMVTLFGVGLIGSSISAAIQSKLSLDIQELPFVWNNPAVQEIQLEAIQQKIVDMLGRYQKTSFDLVWSAGRAGFSASAKETGLELDSYQRVLSMANQIADNFPRQVRGLHLISSAGGLFLGQRYVNCQSEPSPQIPYGKLKMDQERMLFQLQDKYYAYVYRLSTVYGTIKAGQRRGLITALISNGIQKKISYITGRMTTLRDFVYAEEVAQFVTAKLYNQSRSRKNIFMLVSGKPTTIQEIKIMVEDMIKHKIYVNYLLDPSNEQDIIFSPSVIPKDWQPSWLRHTIPLIFRDALSTGELFTG